MSTTVYVCTGRSCSARFSPYIITRLKNDRAKFFSDDDIAIESCMCRGKCEESPVLETEDGLHNRMSPVTASALLAKVVARARSKVSQPKN